MKWIAMRVLHNYALVRGLAASRHAVRIVRGNS